MLLPAKILRLFICLCFLFLSAQSVSAQDRAAVERGYESYVEGCLLYTSPSPRDRQKSRMPSSA